MVGEYEVNRSGRRLFREVLSAENREVGLVGARSDSLRANSSGPKPVN